MKSLVLSVDSFESVGRKMTGASPEVCRVVIPESGALEGTDLPGTISGMPGRLLLPASPNCSQMLKNLLNKYNLSSHC